MLENRISLEDKVIFENSISLADQADQADLENQIYLAGQVVLEDPKDLLVPRAQVYLEDPKGLLVPRAPVYLEDRACHYIRGDPLAHAGPVSCRRPSGNIQTRSRNQGPQ